MSAPASMYGGLPTASSPQGGAIPLPTTIPVASSIPPPTPQAPQGGPISVADMTASGMAPPPPPPPQGNSLLQQMGLGLPSPVATATSIPPPTPQAPQGGPISVADMTASGMAPPPPPPPQGNNALLQQMGLPSPMSNASPIPPPTPQAPQGGPISVADMTASGMAPPPPPPPQGNSLLQQMGLPSPMSIASPIPPPTPQPPQGGPISVADMTASGMPPPPPPPQSSTLLQQMALPSPFPPTSPMPNSSVAAAPSPSHANSLLQQMGLHSPSAATSVSGAPSTYEPPHTYPYQFGALPPPTSTAPAYGAYGVAPALTAPLAAAPLPAAPSNLAVPPTMSLEKWLELEAAALRRVPNEEKTRYLDVDEVVRDEVCRLFVQSDYDVLKLLTNITRSLQHIGRHDVGLMRNENLTAFTITQSEAYGGKGGDATLSEVERRRRAVAESIDRIHRSNLASKEVFDRIAAQVAVGQTASTLPVLTATATQAARDDPFRKSAYEEILENIAKQRTAKTREEGKKRSASAHNTKSAGRSLPSTYNGNYLLNRYGGSFPEENYYSKYRYNGVKK